MKIIHTATVATIEDLQQFIGDATYAAVMQANRSVHPSTIYMGPTVRMHLVEEALSDGSTVFNITITDAQIERQVETGREALANMAADLGTRRTSAFHSRW